MIMKGEGECQADSGADQVLSARGGGGGTWQLRRGGMSRCRQKRGSAFNEKNRGEDHAKSNWDWGAKNTGRRGCG